MPQSLDEFLVVHLRLLYVWRICLERNIILPVVILCIIILDRILHSH